MDLAFFFLVGSFLIYFNSYKKKCCVVLQKPVSVDILSSFEPSSCIDTIDYLFFSLYKLIFDSCSLLYSFCGDLGFYVIKYDQ